ncbi:MAG TPA: hypothetical protein VFO78_05435 [Candidatus Limnocylindrales bacterium]|nr:hypothetical protein [Candidatus Limnocylindrales bacterium]
MTHAIVPPPDAATAACAALVGPVVARIQGALRSEILVGLDRLIVCTCGATGPSPSQPRLPWRFVELAGADIVHYGSLPVVAVRPLDRAEPVPVLVLERDQIGPALDGLSTLRRLIADRSGAEVPA